MFQRITVPLDGSPLAEQIVPYVEGLARGLRMPVRLLHVIDPATLEEHLDRQHHRYIDQAMENRRSWAQIYLHDMQKRLEAAGVAVETEIAAGDPAATIAAMAGEEGADLVAMATHGRSGIARWMMGSVADTILHHSHTSLLLFRPREGKTCPARPPETLIVPLDGTAMGEHALATAEALAIALDIPVLLTQAISVQVTAMVEPGATGSELAMWTMEDQETSRAHVYLDAIASVMAGRGIRSDTRVDVGPPGDRLVETAQQTPNSLVVMGTHARGGISRMILGSVADRLVRESCTPVLIVR